MEVTGVVIRQWGRDMPGARCECSLAFMANHLTQLRAKKAALQVLTFTRPSRVAPLEPKNDISVLTADCSNGCRLGMRTDQTQR